MPAVDPTQKLNELLQSFRESGGVEAVILLNSSKQELVASDPNEDSLDKLIKAIAEEVVRRSIGTLESILKSQPNSFQEMQLVTKKQKFLTLKISDDSKLSKYFLLIVCHKDTGKALMEIRFDNIKDEIISVIQDATTPTPKKE
jgi:K+/H+ antiporter YhaU regulatory subunit KhtT